MPDSTLIQQLERRLIALRLPAARRQRAIQELSEHREDLIRAGLEEGLSETEATTRADRSLGDLAEIANQIVLAARRSSWWGRHPFISFCILPFFGMILSICLGAAVALGAFYLTLSAEQWHDLAGGSTALIWMSISLQCAHALVVTLTAWVFCRLITRSVAQPGWLWIASIICSLWAYFLYCVVYPHNIVVGLAVNWPPNGFRITCAAIPCVIALFISLRQRRQLLNKLSPVAAAAALLPLLGSGCVTRKPQPSEPSSHTRAWLGGEYCIAKKYHNTPFTSPRIAYTTNYPTSLTETKAIKVTAIATNAPAFLAGLRPGDYLVEVSHQKVKTLHQLRHLFNSLPAASTVQLKIIRDNNPLDLTVQTGTEKYHNAGYFIVIVPTFVEGWDLWPNPGFSLVFVGYEPFDKLRYDLNGKSELDTAKWHAWCALFEISANDQILSQASSVR